MSNRTEQFAEETARLKRLRQYAQLAFRRPFVFRMLDAATTCFCLEKPAPGRAEFFRVVLHDGIDPTELLMSDCVAAAVHIGTLFNVPEGDTIEWIRHHARPFIRDRTLDLETHLAKKVAAAEELFAATAAARAPKPARLGVQRLGPRSSTKSSLRTGSTDAGRSDDDTASHVSHETPRAKAL